VPVPSSCWNATVTYYRSAGFGKKEEHYQEESASKDGEEPEDPSPARFITASGPPITGPKIGPKVVAIRKTPY